jgi:hypothetical protein
MGGPGSGRRKGGVNKPMNSSITPINLSKMKTVKMPKDFQAKLKKKYGKNAINSPEYKSWVKQNWT